MERGNRVHIKPAYMIYLYEIDVINPVDLNIRAPTSFRVSQSTRLALSSQFIPLDIVPHCLLHSTHTFCEIKLRSDNAYISLEIPVYNAATVLYALFSSFIILGHLK